ncbi:17556_t:CDS:2, partial [Gigaspora margarita]
ILSSQKNGRMIPKVHRTDLHQDTISLSQISRKIKKCINTIQIAEWHKIFQKTNKYLFEINNYHKIEIQLLNIADEIENFIKLRYKHIQNEQDKMLNSLLDYSYNKVKIDRVLDQKEKNLLTYSIELANITKELNSLGCGKEVLELRLKQGLLQAGCIE